MAESVGAQRAAPLSIILQNGRSALRPYDCATGINTDNIWDCRDALLRVRPCGRQEWRPDNKPIYLCGEVRQTLIFESLGICGNAHTCPYTTQTSLEKPYHHRILRRLSSPATCAKYQPDLAYSYI